MSKPNGRDLFNIKIMKWDKHNPKRKKHYKYILVANNLYLHPKINAASTSGRWAYMVLLMMCGDANEDHVSVTRRALNDAVTCRRDAAKVLDELQSLQLLTYDLIPFLRIEENKKKNRIEENRNSVKGETEKKKPSQVEFIDANASPPVESNIGQKLVGVYCMAWKARYKISPPLRKQDTRALKHIGEANGFDRTKNLLESYLRMNESFYVKKRHDLSTFINNLTSVAQFVETGRSLTSQDLKTLDRAISNKNTLDALENGEI